MNISEKEFRRRFQKALSVPFLLDQVCSPNIQAFVSSHSVALGCSEKTFLLPLLSCTAACMGTESYLKLSDTWQEPPILWTLVVTPKSLLRIDIAEHLKQELLAIQNEMWAIEEGDGDHGWLKWKFVFDMFNVDQLQNMLAMSHGHGFGIYNSIRSLHKCMVSPEDVDVMRRLNLGLGLFGDSRVKNSTVSQTRMNLSVISTPSIVQKTLNTAPHFKELFYDCFLTMCAEEKQVKFSQLTTSHPMEKLKLIFSLIMKMHYSPKVYHLSSEAAEKFSQIHDELVDKARQLARKDLEQSIYQPALSYLARLSCVLHVLNTAISELHHKMSITNISSWDTEIGADTVLFARELISHSVEQRHSLLEQTTFSSKSAQRKAQTNLASPKL